MKALTTLIFIFIQSISLFSQVPRDKVIVEIGTGTW